MLLFKKKKKKVEGGGGAFFCTTGDRRILSLFCRGGAFARVRECVDGMGEIVGADGEKKVVCVRLWISPLVLPLLKHSPSGSRDVRIF